MPSNVDTIGHVVTAFGCWKLPLPTIRSLGAGPPQHLQDFLELNFYPKSGFFRLTADYHTAGPEAHRTPRASQSPMALCSKFKGGNR